MEAVNTWEKYLRALTGEAKRTEIIKQTGIPSESFTKWARGTRPSPAAIATIALEYGGNVLDGFVAAGHLTREQADAAQPPRTDISQASDVQVVEEVARRIGVKPPVPRDVNLQAPPRTAPQDRQPRARPARRPPKE